MHGSTSARLGEVYTLGNHAPVNVLKIRADSQEDEDDRQETLFHHRNINLLRSADHPVGSSRYHGRCSGKAPGSRAAMGGQAALPGPSDDLLAKLESIYKDIHANPELSMQERRTAGIAANWLREQGYEVTEGVGGTGVVGLLRNGEGATVLLRADMDALPMSHTSCSLLAGVSKAKVFRGR